MCCFNTFTWNHTVAAYLKAAPDLPLLATQLSSALSTFLPGSSPVSVSPDGEK